MHDAGLQRRGWEHRAQRLWHAFEAIGDGDQDVVAVAACGTTHQRTVIGGGAASVKLEKFLAFNTLLGNLKTAFAGTYHSFDFAK